MKNHLTRIRTTLYYATLNLICRIADRYETPPDPADPPTPGHAHRNAWHAPATPKEYTHPKETHQ